MTVATIVEMFNQINNNFLKFHYDLHPRKLFKKKIAPPFERQTQRKRDTSFLSMIQYLIDKKCSLLIPQKYTNVIN